MISNDNTKLGLGISKNHSVDYNTHGNYIETQQNATLSSTSPQSQLVLNNGPDPFAYLQQMSQLRPQNSYQRKSSYYSQQKNHKSSQKQNRTRITSQEMEKDANVTVFVGNLTDQTSKAELRNIFSQFGM